MDLRATLILSAAAGLALAGAGSLLLAGRSEAAAVAGLDTRLAAIPARPARGAGALVTPLLQAAPPLFPSAGGPNPSTELSVALEGVARSPERVAALLAIGGKPSEWLAQGETRDGVTLAEVGARGVTIDTARGERSLALGEGSSPPSANPAPSSASITPAEGPPQGFHTPPEPASAPGAAP